MDTRAWVYDALLAVIVNGTYSNLYLKDHLRELPPEKRPLATRMFYGTIQNLAWLEWVWSQYANPKKTSKKAAVLLDLALFQILFMDKVPAYAAIHDMVELAKKRLGSKQAGFINGVLRSITRSPIPEPADQLEALALKSSLPLWLLKLWNAQYGQEAMEQMAASANAALPVYVRLSPDNPPAWDDSLQPYGKDMAILTGEVASSPAYQNGQITVQDPGSHAIAQFLQVQPEDTVLDLCAAPGTKTLDIAQQLKGGHITALDLHPHRTALIESDARRLHQQDKVTAVCMDATDTSGLGTFDKVLCDVPCSGFGVLARKPDLKLKLDPAALDELLPIQKKLLESGADRLKAGGTLVYSTCTLNKKENEKQVQAFLAAHPDFVLDQEQTIFPDETHNGFYMARLKKEMPQ